MGTNRARGACDSNLHRNVSMHICWRPRSEITGYLIGQSKTREHTRNCQARNIPHCASTRGSTKSGVYPKHFSVHLCHPNGIRAAANRSRSDVHRHARAPGKGSCFRPLDGSALCGWQWLYAKSPLRPASVWFSVQVSIRLTPSWQETDGTQARSLAALRISATKQSWSLARRGVCV